MVSGGTEEEMVVAVLTTIARRLRASILGAGSCGRWSRGCAWQQRRTGVTPGCWWCGSRPWRHCSCGRSSSTGSRRHSRWWSPLPRVPQRLLSSTWFSCSSLYAATHSHGCVPLVLVSSFDEEMNYDRVWVVRLRGGRGTRGDGGREKRGRQASSLVRRRCLGFHSWLAPPLSVIEKNEIGRVKFPKTLFTLSVQDLEGDGFCRPAIQIVDACRRSGWRRQRLHISKLRQNLTQVWGYLWWRLLSAMYRITSTSHELIGTHVTIYSWHDKESCHDLVVNRYNQATKNKKRKKIVPHVYGTLSSLPSTMIWSKSKASTYINYSHSTQTSNVVLLVPPSLWTLRFPRI